MRRVCAVIPAAGRGTRLGLCGPKILTPVQPGTTIWSILRDKLLPLVDHIQVVLSPAGVRAFDANVSGESRRSRISVTVQDEPVGMGDAVFQGQGCWQRFDDILVVWGDQVNLSSGTLQAVLATQGHGSCPGITMPVVRLQTPYVQYEFGSGERMIRLRQVREGDRTDDTGWSDVGTFCLSAEGLVGAWKDYLQVADRGASTREINFLPFLLYLSRERGWPVRHIAVADSAEARGVNTPEDLEFARIRAAG